MSATADDLHRALERWRDGALNADDAALLRAALDDAGEGRTLLRQELRLLGRFTLALGHDADRPGLGRALQERLRLEDEAPLFTAAWRRRSQRRQRLLLAALLLLSAAFGTALLWTLGGGELTKLLVDGQQRPLRAGLLVAEASTESQILWPARSCSVTVAPGGRLLLQQQDGGFAFRLEAGAAWFSAGPQESGQPLRLHTPDCSAEVLGTRWHCRVADEGTALAVQSGAVAIRSHKASAVCRGGEYVVVRQAGDLRTEVGDAAAARAALLRRDPRTATAADPGNTAAPVPELVLLPDRHSAPSTEPALLLAAAAATPLRLDVRHRDVESHQGDGLPPPWKAHNWDPDGRSELFTETVDGAVVLTMRNHDGHGIMLAPYRRVTVPAGSIGEIVLQYRCRERGRLAVAINVDGTRSDTVQAPRIHQGWHTAVFHFAAGERDRSVAMNLLNQTVGPDNDVLLRRAALHVLASDDSTD